MTQEQIEAKALEEFPETTGYPLDPCTDRERAAFIKGCQYAATASAVSRKEADKFVDEYVDTNIQADSENDARDVCHALLDYLQSKALSLAQPGYSPVSAVKDDDGHWYVIPKELETTFFEMEAIGHQDEYEEFGAMFECYRTGGDLNLIQLYTLTPHP